MGVRASVGLSLHAIMPAAKGVRARVGLTHHAIMPAALGVRARVGLTRPAIMPAALGVRARVGLDRHTIKPATMAFHAACKYLLLHMPAIITWQACRPAAHALMTPRPSCIILKLPLIGMDDGFVCNPTHLLCAFWGCSSSSPRCIHGRQGNSTGSGTAVCSCGSSSIGAIGSGASSCSCSSSSWVPARGIDPGHVLRQSQLIS